MKAQTHSLKVKELKRFASQFTAWEWHILCGSSVFLEAVTDSVARAAYHASLILKRPVHFVCMKEKKGLPLVTHVHQREKGMLPFKLHPRL